MPCWPDNGSKLCQWGSRIRQSSVVQVSKSILLPGRCNFNLRDSCCFEAHNLRKQISVQKSTLLWLASADHAFDLQGSAFIDIWVQTDFGYASASSALYSSYVGTISAACSDGTILPTVTDGSSFSSQCPFPTSISRPYSNSSSTGFKSFVSRYDLSPLSLNEEQQPILSEPNQPLPSAR